ncbi:hypothetical protein IB270_24480 [Ensifer sp. ENS05]|nr:hypothetical protein [Ensifer sp. ENS05]
MCFSCQPPSALLSARKLGGSKSAKAPSRFHADSEPPSAPVLAEEWSASSNARTWTFKIRKGVQFHNGKTLTPDDVVANIERHSDESALAPRQTKLPSDVEKSVSP